ncbi:MAG: ATP-binding protein [Candidatus Pacebacteria bacterium]|nr:ATP-binding protein [Candidatus Paceibacterota bacterium]
MDFEEFVISGSRAIRHDLVNALFIAQAYNELEMDQSEKLQKISSQMEKAFSIMEVWKELEVFGEIPSWQELRTLLLKVKLQSERTSMEIDVQNVKLNANGLFHFVFTNLIDNSMRHGEKKDIKIKISSKIEGSELLIIYEDDGKGIPERDKSRIFAQGFGKHTGLGMFFARQIIELMGGTIKENGVPGEGVKFEIRLPEDSYKASNGDL